MPQTVSKSAEERENRLKGAAKILLSARNILILMHKSPDGDTLGSAFGLCRALLKLGKSAKVICSDPIPKRYGYLVAGADFDKPDLIVASDIATVGLFGDSLEQYAQKVDLCIDHHPSNSGYAKYSFVDPSAAATCEIMTELIGLLGVEIDKNIAECLYTGLATDTGCFRFSNTTPKTLRTAAELIDKGADNAKLNKLLFETVSRGRLEIEKMALETLEYHMGGRVALITLTNDMYEKAGVDESETEGIPSIPATIEGVEAGITIRENGPGAYKISLRTNGALDASNICSMLGGGGHAAAAGCRATGSLDDAKRAILAAVEKQLKGENG